MEIVLLLLLVCLLIWVRNTVHGTSSSQHHRFDRLEEELRSLRAELAAFRQAAPADRAAADPELAANEARAAAPAALWEPVPRVVAPPPPAAAPPPAETAEPAFVQEEPAAADPFPGKTLEPVEEPEPTLKPAWAAAPVYAEAEPRPSYLAAFLQNNPDLEKFIGENLINKIGIAILVLGIGYFVKFAIDQDWINEIGRVAIGILCGGVLLGLAHRLRRTFAPFSSVLVGGGLAVLYFTIAIAFHEYQLFSQTAAFSLMVVITAFAVLLAVQYDRSELAVLALLGGFATPFMVSTGEGNYQVLFTYVLILNTGMLVLAYLKGWRILNWISYGFTVLLYGGWLSSRVLPGTTGPYVGALVFGTLFYLVFFLMIIANNLRERRPFQPADIFLLLSNNFFYYMAGALLLREVQDGRFLGLFTVAMAAVNFGFASVLFRSGRADRNLVYLLIGLVITFISLAIPVQLKGNYITMFWALEAVLLLWLGQKTGMRFIGSSSVPVLSLMGVSLLMDWLQFYGTGADYQPPAILLNKGFVTGVLALAAVVLTRWLLKAQTEPLAFKVGDLAVEPYRRGLHLTLGIFLYLVLWLELHHQLSLRQENAAIRALIYGSFNLSYLLGLLLYACWRRSPELGQGAWILGLLGVVAYVAWFSPQVMKLVEHHFLFSGPLQPGFGFHYLNLVLVGALLMQLYRQRGPLLEEWPDTRQPILWFLCATVVYICSAELLYHVLYFRAPVVNLSEVNDPGLYQSHTGHFWSLVRQTNKVGFPILWGFCAFGLMYLGLKRKDRSLRIIALSLFSLTLLKLFLYDIRGISEGGKIAAFISLGVLLLIISFMYQNLKRLILLDEPALPAEE